MWMRNSARMRSATALTTSNPSSAGSTWLRKGRVPSGRATMREVCREAVYLLAGEWNLSLEEAFILLSIRADVGVAQACKTSPFATIARVAMPKLEAIPGPFRS
jgi:acetamidase/formamidase